MDHNVVEALPRKVKEHIAKVVDGIKFTKNFRSATAEEWYVFLPGYQDPYSGGAAGKTIVHYDLIGNKDVFINTTVILDDPQLHLLEHHALVYAISEEIVNRLVGYANTLLSVHCGSNSYQAEFIS
ncbi:hypothetical protein [Paenibacillus prosopidis]|uniref:Uncharacterized protein n=1 Tax=Paenibacillus prosopidis TaxID=630520 RepID=A0A368VQZ3_9BACL|nr:hypothetical protein [Paenibacillus prosopidis]RCW42376.1 hypothetical protein DFP97_117100 [Paenibacillus prosopidis]